MTGRVDRDEAARELLEAEHRYRALVEASPDAIVIHDGDEILFANAAAAAIAGAPDPADLVGRFVSSLVEPRDVTAIRALVDRLTSDHDTQDVSIDLQVRNRGTFPLHVSARRVTWAGRRAIQLVAHDRRPELARLRDQAAQRELENRSGDAIIHTDATFRIEGWSRGAEALFGWTEQEALGRVVDELIGYPDSGLDTPAARWELFETGVWRGTIRHRHRDGHAVVVDSLRSLVHGERGEVIGVVEIVRPALRASEHGALDQLTGLPTREELLAGTSGRGAAEPMVMILVDLDHFSELNTRLGEAAGDELLVAVAGRLTGVLRSGDLLVRVGADRFAVQAFAADPPEAREMAALLARAIEASFEIGTERISVSASIGGAWGPAGSTGVELLGRAERALREAEDAGGGCVRMLELADGLGEAAFAEDLRGALDRGELVVHYQPIVELSTGRLRKLEALVRWHRPGHGLVMPDDLVPVAERIGCMPALGGWVVERACRDLAALWQYDDLGTVSMCVNLSAAQLAEQGLVERVADALESSGVAPSSLWLEVTETTMLDAPGVDVLEKLRALGVAIAVDDFGTGYAGLQYLKKLPVDAVKLDRSFVAGLGIDTGDTAIVRSVINLARELGLHTVAEGVETESQRAQLVALGCRLAQGWLFGRAVPLAELVLGTTLDLAPGHVGPPAGDDEPERLAALEACRIMDTAPEESFDGLTRLTAQVLEAPVALLSFVDSDRQWFKSRFGSETIEVPRAGTFASYAIVSGEEVYVVEDAAADPRFATHTYVTNASAIRFYGGAPIRSREGYVLGMLCIGDRRPRTLDASERSKLVELAGQASHLLDLRRRTIELNDLLRVQANVVTTDGLSDVERQLVDTSSELVVVMGRDGIVRHANAATWMCFGQRPDEWIGRDGLEAVHPDDWELAMESFARAAVVSGTHVPVVLRIARGDGSYAVAEVVANNRLGVHGVDGIVLSIRDVSEQTAIVDAIERQRILMDTAMDALTEGVVACDANGELILFNRAAQHIHGRPRRPGPAEGWIEKHGPFAADGTTRLRVDELPLQRALAGEQVVDMEIVVSPPNERPRRVLCNGHQLVDRSGRVIGAVVVMRELSTTGELPSAGWPEPPPPIPTPTG